MFRYTQITLTFLYLYKPDEQSDISQVKYVPVFPRCKKYNCMQANKNLLDWLPHFVWHHGCKPKMKAVLTQRTWSVLVQCIRSRHRCSCWLPTSPGCSYCCITVLLWWQTYYYSGVERRGFTGLRKKKKKKRATKGCDAPLSLLCSVCKNTHCREKSQGGEETPNANSASNWLQCPFYPSNNSN